MSGTALTVTVIDAVLFDGYGLWFAVPGYITYGVLAFCCYSPILARWIIVSRTERAAPHPKRETHV